MTMFSFCLDQSCNPGRAECCERFAEDQGCVAEYTLRKRLVQDVLRHERLNPEGGELVSILSALNLDGLV